MTQMTPLLEKARDYLLLDCSQLEQLAENLDPSVVMHPAEAPHGGLSILQDIPKLNVLKDS